MLDESRSHGGGEREGIEVPSLLVGSTSHIQRMRITLFVFALIRKTNTWPTSTAQD
jgi:hypothetical protein